MEVDLKELAVTPGEVPTVRSARSEQGAAMQTICRTLPIGLLDATRYLRPVGIFRRVPGYDHQYSLRYGDLDRISVLGRGRSIASAPERSRLPLIEWLIEHSEQESQVGWSNEVRRCPVTSYTPAENPPLPFTGGLRRSLV